MNACTNNEPILQFFYCRLYLRPTSLLYIVKAFLLCSSFQTPKEIEIIVVGAAANIFSEAAKGIFHDVKHHIGYHDVDAAEKNRKKIKAQVQDWRSRVDKVIAEEEKKVRDLEVKAKH
ncbi:hypothetical protein GQ457_02G035270 [Hibiscus cannabinus]